MISTQYWQKMRQDERNCEYETLWEGMSGVTSNRNSLMDEMVASADRLNKDVAISEMFT